MTAPWLLSDLGKPTLTERLLLVPDALRFEVLRTSMMTAYDVFLRLTDWLQCPQAKVTRALATDL
ncbi:MAG: hypothetical protein BRC33_01455 [Cyanobacteria bacterium SW_9_44_58]|nr:MAG: hypothetical protein BRC33_01455 [Cyanobacteria bacterium SW_9_44_58]